MKRLTQLFEGKWIIDSDTLETVAAIPLYDETGRMHLAFAGTFADRLAAYEDAGLEPEEVKRVQETLVTAQRLKKEQYDVMEKYLKSEAEDRLVILPYKVGTEVFALWYGANVIPGTVIGYSLHEWSEAASVRVLFDTKKVNGTRDYSMGAFGKTLFSSREEAESALKGETHGNM